MSERRPENDATPRDPARVDDAALSAYLDGEADGAERRRIDDALAADPELRDRYNALLRLSAVLTPDADDRRAAASIRAALRRRRTRRRWLPRVLLGAGGAAALLLVAVPMTLTLRPAPVAPVGGDALVAEARLALGELGGRGGLGDPGWSVASLAAPGSSDAP